MAVLTRRTWANLRDEALKRIGRSGDSAASSRVEYWIDAVYRNLALTYHHYELDTELVDQALAEDADELALPADCYVLLAVRLKTNAGVDIGRLLPERASFTIGARSSSTEQPKTYARFGAKIYFPAPADDAYKLDLYYYKVPTAPDFSSGSPAWDRLWDEYLVQGACDLAMRGYWVPELAAGHAQSLAAFLDRVVNPQLASGILTDSEDRRTTDQPHGGAQG